MGNRQATHATRVRRKAAQARRAGPENEPTDVAPTGRAPLSRSVETLLEREKRLREQFGALLTVSRAVANTLDLSTVLATIAKADSARSSQTDECTVFVHGRAGQGARAAVCDGAELRERDAAVRLKLGEGITGWSHSSGRGEIVNDAESTEPALPSPSFKAHGSISFT